MGQMLVHNRLEADVVMPHDQVGHFMHADRREIPRAYCRSLTANVIAGTGAGDI
jgi:hypothetical protein